MNYYGNNNDYRDYLAHHGILGMKWGKRNGPPYPLGASDHSASEKKAGWRKSLGSSGRSPSKKRIRPISEKEKRQYKERQIAEHDKSLPKEKKALSPEEKAARKELTKKIILGTAVAAGVGAGIYLAYKYHSVNDISKLKDITPDAAKEIMSNNLKEVSTEEIKKSIIDNSGDMIIPKGNEFHRIAYSKGIDYSKVKEATYVSRTEKDRNAYMGYLKDWGGTGNRYEYTFKAVQDIKMPSRDKARKIFEELWQNDPQYQRELRGTLESTYFDLFSKRPDMKYMTDQQIRLFARQEAATDLQTVDDAFDAGVYAIVKRRNDSKKLISEFVKKGYNAIEDYHDSDTIIFDSPMILFNPSDTVVKVGEQRVTEAMTMLARKKFASMGGMLM